MGKRKKTEQELLSEYAEGIKQSIARWEEINRNGCNDPFWTDGCNMNLCRNHVMYYKHQIATLCDTCQLPIPEEYYLPTPPKVDENYMAHLKQTERVKRLRFSCQSLTTQKTVYDKSQLSLF